MGFLQGKKALIVGLASERSIAHGIAEAMHREGAQLAFTYQNERLEERVTKMAAELQSNLVFPCDVADDNQINDVFTALNKEWDNLDILVHSVAYAPADQIQGDYVENLTREGFRIAHDISSYSLGALAKAAFPMMKDKNGAIITLSYLGAVRAVSNYNTMGLAKASLEANVRYLAGSLGPHNIRVNAISAGPIRTLAAAGIKGFRDILSYNEKVTPLRRNVSTEDVGNVAAFLCSDLAAGVTGDVVYVDAGYHIVGIPSA
jgi:enoyl-[acyl-carrier protein] reductase I